MIRITGLALLILLGRLTCAEPIGVPISPVVCPVYSINDFIFASLGDVCSVNTGFRFPSTTGVIEGGEVILQKALHMVHKNEHDYVALLFYASWCPFSGSCRPSFSVLSSIFPSIPHFAIEESAVRPSVLSKYGIHGFPTLVLLNSTVWMQYQGSRSLNSLLSFYGDITGIDTAGADGVYLDKIGCPGYDGKDKTYQETCPFPWARSPENLLQQETYLALATIFVILRLLYLGFPTFRRYSQIAWRYIINANLSSLWEHPLLRVKSIIHSLNSVLEPCKKSNLQEGAKNAKAWASQSLATVSLGDPSSSHDVLLH